MQGRLGAQPYRQELNERIEKPKLKITHRHYPLIRGGGLPDPGKTDRPPKCPEGALH